MKQDISQERQFIYFPSFSVGNFSNAMKQDKQMRDGMPFRFYAPDFPDEFRHKYFLVTAGHFYKKDDFINEWGFNDYGPDHMKLMGDSGGFQIASGAIKWDKAIRPKILNWLENNSHVAMNLDIPPRLKYNGKFSECLEISKDNFKFFSDNRKGKTEFLNVLQGDDELAYRKWYDEVKGFDFEGWGIGGCGGSIYRFMSGICALMQGKEQYNDNRKWLHILGTSKVVDFLILSQLQKSLNDVNSKMQVTTDSSSPSLAVVYGKFYHSMNLKKASFGPIHIPKERAETNRSYTKHTDNTISAKPFFMPETCQFDKQLRGQYTYEDLRDWTIEGYGAAVLHNFMFFKDSMEKINTYVYSSPYILEQVISSDNFLLLRAIDEMVKAYDNATTPEKVFARYKHLFLKMSTTGKASSIVEHEFYV